MAFASCSANPSAGGNNLLPFFLAGAGLNSRVPLMFMLPLIFWLSVDAVPSCTPKHCHPFKIAEWIAMVIDAHFTNFIISCTSRDDLYEELKNLHHLVSNEVVRCELLESIRGWLVQLKKSEEVCCPLPSCSWHSSDSPLLRPFSFPRQSSIRSIPDYSIETVNLE